MHQRNAVRPPPFLVRRASSPGTGVGTCARNGLAVLPRWFLHLKGVETRMFFVLFGNERSEGRGVIRGRQPRAKGCSFPGSKF